MVISVLFCKFLPVRDHVRTILSQTPSHLNVTASADQGSPVSAPTISQTSVKGNLNINQNCKLRTCQSEVCIYIYIYIYNSCDM